MLYSQEDFDLDKGSSLTTPEDDGVPFADDTDKQRTGKRPRSESAEVVLIEESTKRLNKRVTKLEGQLAEQKLKNEELKIGQIIIS